MKLSVSLIRSGMTSSGRDGRVCGLQEEALLPENIEELKEKAAGGSYPQAELVFTSGLLRARETAALIYPKVLTIITRDLDAFDFGEYTGKTYHQIIEDKQFPQWAQARQLTAFPGGASPHYYSARCILAFQNVVEEMLQKGIASVSIVTHRMAIQHILQRFYFPRSYYNDWSVLNGGGYTMEYSSRLKAAVIKEIF